MLRLDGYIRVSRVGGREGESFISPEVQREQIETWARLMNAQIIEPLLLARGRLERAGEDQIIPLTRDNERERIPPIVNMIVRELAPLERFVRGEDDVEVGSSMRAVAPPVQSFAQGHRR